MLKRDKSEEPSNMKKQKKGQFQKRECRQNDKSEKATYLS